MIERKFCIDWVIEASLAVGSLPKKEEHIEILKKEKIVSILSLCEERLYTSFNYPKDKFNYRRIILPDHQTGTLPTLEQLKNCMVYLEELISKGATYVHCYAGAERSPLVCTAWLIRKHNLRPQEALDYVMQIHKGTNPLPGQLLLLGKFN